MNNLLEAPEENFPGIKILGWYDIIYGIVLIVIFSILLILKNTSPIDILLFFNIFIWASMVIFIGIGILNLINWIRIIEIIFSGLRAFALIGEFSIYVSKWPPSPLVIILFVAIMNIIKLIYFTQRKVAKRFQSP